MKKFEFDEQDLNNIALTAAVTAYVCPICRMLIVPTYQIKECGDATEVTYDISRTFIKNSAGEVSLVCCEECGKRIPH